MVNFGGTCRIFIWFFIVSFIYLLVFAIYTSPIHSAAWGDSQVFVQLGRGLLEGKLPYIDLFDHKGFLLYAINALGLFIGGLSGVFFLQVINFTTFLFLSYKTIHVISKEVSSVFVLFCSLMVMTAYCEGCNLSEEWSLPWIALPIYLSIKIIYSSDDSIFDTKELICIGLSLSVIALLRINNFFPVLGFILYPFIKQIHNKEFLVVIRSALVIALSFFVPILLVVLFYFYVDGINGISTLYFGTIGFNLEYMQRFVFDLPLGFKIKSYAPIVFAMIISFVPFKENKDLVIPLVLSYLLGLLVVGSTLYRHYFLVFLPLIPITIACLRSSRYWKVYNALLFAVFIIASFNPIVQVVDLVETQKYAILERKKQFKRVVSSVPQEERNDIWNYNAGDALDLLNEEGIVQCNRIILPFQIGISSRLATEEEGVFISQRPKWVLWMNGTSLGQNDDYSFLVSNYHRVDSTTVKLLNNVVLMRVNE